MKRTFAVIIIFASFLLYSQYSFANDDNILHNEYHSYTAVIEDVIDITDKGFRNIKYIVKWEGNRIIVPDQNLYVQKKKGDELKFLVMWQEIKTEDGSIKNLSFSALE